MVNTENSKENKIDKEIINGRNENESRFNDSMKVEME